MTHPQVFGQKFTSIRMFSAWKTHPFWPHIPNMIQYVRAPRDISYEFIRAIIWYIGFNI